MNIRETLLEEHSKTQIAKLISYIGHDRLRLAALVDVFLHGQNKLAQRAIWPIADIGVQHPEMLQPYLTPLLQKAQEPNVHVAVKRHVMRLFQVVELPEALHSSLLNLAFGFLNNPTEAIAVRVCSMTVLQRLTQIYPDLAQELRLVLADTLMNERSPGLISRAKTVLKQLAEMK